MKLYFDESVGQRVPSALRHIGAPCQAIDFPTRAGAFRLGMPDLEWIPLAGSGGYLSISHDLHMLEVPEERRAIVSAGLGAVFIDAGHAARWEVLRLVLVRWEWLAQLDERPRPFAIRMRVGGHVREVSL